MNIKVIHAELLVNADKTDLLILTTEFPSGIYPYKGTQKFETRLAGGTGVEWCRKQGIEAKITICNY